MQPLIIRPKNLKTPHCLFRFALSDTDVITNYEYKFNALYVEENQLSVSGQHMKYYIEDDSHTVIIGFVFKYR